MKKIITKFVCQALLLLIASSLLLYFLSLGVGPLFISLVTVLFSLKG